MEESLRGLHRAVWTHDVDTVQRLVDAGADVSKTVVIDGRTYDLLDLVWPGHHTDVALALKCIDILVAAGLALTFDHVYKHIGSPPDVLRALLDHGAPIQSHTGDLPLLMAAIRTGTSEKVRLLLEFGADPNESMSFRYMSITPTVPIHMAIYESNLDTIYVLCEYGADPYAIDTVSGVTSLGWARHMARHTMAASKYHSMSSHILQFFENVYECRNFHARHWDALKKELMEAVWHPARLQKLAYFDDL
jgi:hypothetical protein